MLWRELRQPVLAGKLTATEALQLAIGLGLVFTVPVLALAVATAWTGSPAPFCLFAGDALPAGVVVLAIDGALLLALLLWVWLGGGASLLARATEAFGLPPTSAVTVGWVVTVIVVVTALVSGVGWYFATQLSC
jgi:hypothetical protein